MRRDGTLLKIFRKYFSREEAQQMTSFLPQPATSIKHQLHQ
jgi:hypothetical protein